MMTRMVKNWHEKGLICRNCGSDKSVKYEVAGRSYCNACVLSIIGSGDVLIGPAGRKLYTDKLRVDSKRRR